MRKLRFWRVMHLTQVTELVNSRADLKSAFLTALSAWYLMSEFTKI